MGSEHQLAHDQMIFCPPDYFWMMNLESCASHGGVLHTARFLEYFWVKFVIEAEKHEPPCQQIYLVSIILW